MVTTANRKYKQGADNEHNDKASLPNFIRQRIFRDSDYGGKRLRHFHFNLSQI
jgi:hypothetical protein